MSQDCFHLLPWIGIIWKFALYESTCVCLNFVLKKRKEQRRDLHCKVLVLWTQCEPAKPTAGIKCYCSHDLEGNITLRPALGVPELAELHWFAAAFAGIAAAVQDCA